MPIDETTFDRGPVPTGPVHVLDRPTVRRWAALARAALASRRDEIDALNVFPVPDGDTGTNLHLTFEGALEGMHDDVTAETTASGLVSLLAREMLLSARGNSGVILSQFTRGFAEATAGHSELDGRVITAALSRAAELGRAAVGAPQEGTILTVADAAAAAAAALPADAGAPDVCRAAAEGARDALARTPELLPALAAAHVVDAGGAGLVLVLEALDRAASGSDDRLHLAAGERPEPWGRAVLPPAASAQAAPGPAFEVVFLLEEANEQSMAALRGILHGLGDSLVVVGDENLWKVHVHVDDVGAAIEAGIEHGRPRQIRVTHLHAHPGGVAAHGHDTEPPTRDAAQATALVAAAAGPGLGALLDEAGAHVITSAPGRRASTRSFVDGIHAACAAGQRRVIVLPNDSDTLLSAQAAASAVRADGIEAAVVGVRAAVQSVAAVAVFEPALSLRENAVAMQAAASATRHGAVTVASKQALTSAGACEPGDVLGIIDGDVVLIGQDVTEVAEDIVARLLSVGGELLTVLLGEGAPGGVGERLAEVAHRTSLGVEVEEIAAGQPNYPVLIGVE